GGTFIYGYDNYGRLSRIERPDGSVEERTYDAAGQLTEQVDKDKEGNILQNNIYKYDVFGEITEKTTSTEGDLSKLISVTMEYDAANRLTKYNVRMSSMTSRAT
ncbi:MAG: RHS repeat protein, partial [Lachnospiraceae bacterium]|nr:RHS repeat protein [Lachnospiraceae bacterium]